VPAPRQEKAGEEAWRTADPYAFLPQPQDNHAVHTEIYWSDGTILRPSNTPEQLAHHLERTGGKVGMEGLKLFGGPREDHSACAQALRPRDVMQRMPMSALNASHRKHHTGRAHEQQQGTSSTTQPAGQGPRGTQHC